MPLIKYRKKTYQLRWTPEWDAILLAINEKYRNPNGFIYWRVLEEKGLLKGLPVNCSRKDFSHRLTYLIRIKYNPYYKGPPQKGFYEHTDNFKKRLKLFKTEVPILVKVENGHKSKQVWSKNQVAILLQLAEKYRVSKNKIDWKKLILDKKVRFFPQGYTLGRLRSFYWQKMSTPQSLEKRRTAALLYKKKNYKKYKKSLCRNKKIVRESVNALLMSRLKIR
jgi:hypothetical protein